MTTVQIPLPYDPNPKQASFHGLNAKYRGFCGGWGNGKTSGGVAEFFIRLMEYPGTNSIIARKTRPELRTTTWDMLVRGDTQETGWRGIPKEVIKVYNKSDLYIELQNGSMIHGLPLDDPKKLENYNLGLYLVDQGEEVEEEFFIKLQGRLRQHAAPREGLWLFNPDGHNWLWRRFIDPKRKPNWRKIHQCIEATPFDNPNLPPDYLDQFSSLPRHWYDRYVLGSHEVFVGQIFTDFNPEVHIVEPFYIPQDWERWMCIDPGIGHEGAASWFARDWDDNLYYYREIVTAGQAVPWWAEEIQNAELQEDYGGPEEEMFVRLIGPEAQQRQQGDGRTVYGVYSEEGIDDLEIADKDPLARINRIIGRLRPTVGHDNPTGAPQVECYDNEGNYEGMGAPTLYFFDTLAYNNEWFPQYRWRPTRPTYHDEDPPEKPRKKHDHTVDNIGHVLVSIGDSVPEVPQNSRPINPEDKWLYDHFESELAAAQVRTAGNAWRPGKKHPLEEAA
jgi:phage terminase large subunit